MIKSSKEVRFVARQRTEEMMKDIENVENNFELLYEVIVENSDKKYSELIKIINDRLNKNYTYKKIKEKCEKMTITYPDRVKEIMIILSLSVAKEKEDKYKAMLIQVKLDKINKEKAERLKIKNDGINNKTKTDNQLKHDEKIKETDRFMDNVLEGKEIDIENLPKTLAFIKQYLRKYDKEKYLEFLIAIKNLKPVSIEESKQLLEVVRYFKKHIEENIIRFKKVDLDNKEEVKKANSIYNIDTSNYSEITKNNPRMILSRKIERLEILYELYSKYEKLLECFIENKKLNTKTALTPAETKALKGEYDFINDYYTNFMAVCDANNKFVKGVNTISEKEYKKLNNYFTKKMIMEYKGDNNEQ